MIQLLPQKTALVPDSADPAQAVNYINEYNDLINQNREILFHFQ